VSILARFGFDKWARSLAQLDTPRGEDQRHGADGYARGRAYTVDPSLAAATTPSLMEDIEFLRETGYRQATPGSAGGAPGDDEGRGCYRDAA
jgi:hypothetical protein